jgi:hypothetical protein
VQSPRVFRARARRPPPNSNYFTHDRQDPWSRRFDFIPKQTPAVRCAGCVTTCRVSIVGLIVTNLPPSTVCNIDHRHRRPPLVRSRVSDPRLRSWKIALTTWCSNWHRSPRRHTFALSRASDPRIDDQYHHPRPRSAYIAIPMPMMMILLRRALLTTTE